MDVYRTAPTDLAQVEKRFRDATFSLLCAESALRSMVRIGELDTEVGERWKAAVELGKQAAQEIGEACAAGHIDASSMPHRTTLLHGPYLRRHGVGGSSALIYKFQTRRVRAWIRKQLDLHVAGGSARALANLPDPRI